MKTTVGTPWKGEWANVNTGKYGTTVLTDGSPVGWSVGFGTGFDNEAEANFWSKHAYLVPAYIVNG